MMFNVGDKVRALDDGTRYKITSRGWIGYVIKVINDNIIYVSSNNRDCNTENGWRVMARCLN